MTNGARIPQTDSIEELARFWDEHDLTDFEEELEEVTDSVFQHDLGTVVLVRFRPEELDTLNRLARAKGVEQMALVHEWVLEKLTIN